MITSTARSIDKGCQVAGSRQRGFSMFELTVYILVASILFSVMVNRYRDLPGEAERANFLGVLMQVKAGVNLQMMKAIAGGYWHELALLEGSNPMNLMLELPSNYVGEFGLVNQDQMPRRIWYFDTTTGELVYRVNDASRLVTMAGNLAQPVDELRFRIVSQYQGQTAETIQRNISGLFSQNESFALQGNQQVTAARGAWEGLILLPVIPYDWGTAGAEMIASQ